MLRRGDVVSLFPEGTISTAFVPCPPRLGAARLALAVGCPIVPAAVWGGQRVITKGRSELRPPYLRTRGVLMTVTFGAPILPEPGEDPHHLMARVCDVEALRLRSEETQARRRRRTAELAAVSQSHP